jgi:hypothetical protein
LRAIASAISICLYAISYAILAAGSTAYAILAIIWLAIIVLHASIPIRAGETASSAIQVSLVAILLAIIATGIDKGSGIIYRDAFASIKVAAVWQAAKSSSFERWEASATKNSAPIILITKLLAIFHTVTTESSSYCCAIVVAKSAVSCA